MAAAGSARFARLYHSVALLLPDATVWVAGSNPTQGNDEPHMEIYAPPYLFTRDADGQVVAAVRPTLSSAPAVVGYGSTFPVKTPDAPSIGAIALMRPGRSDARV